MVAVAEGDGAAERHPRRAAGGVAPAVGEREVEAVDERRLAAALDGRRRRSRRARARPLAGGDVLDERVADVPGHRRARDASGRGRGLNGRLAAAGSGGPPPAVVVAQAPGAGADGCGVAGEGPAAATVANAVRGSAVTFRRRAIVLAAAAVSVAPVGSSVTPFALLIGATASVSSVERRPPSSAVTRGLEPSSSRGAPSVTLRSRRAAAALRPFSAPCGRRRKREREPPAAARGASRRADGDAAARRARSARAVTPQRAARSAFADGAVGARWRRAGGAARQRGEGERGVATSARDHRRLRAAPGS